MHLKRRDSLVLQNQEENIVYEDSVVFGDSSFCNCKQDSQP